MTLFKPAGRTAGATAALIAEVAILEIPGRTTEALDANRGAATARYMIGVVGEVSFCEYEKDSNSVTTVIGNKDNTNPLSQ